MVIIKQHRKSLGTPKNDLLLPCTKCPWYNELIHLMERQVTFKGVSYLFIR